MTVVQFLFNFGCLLVSISSAISLAYACYSLWKYVDKLGAVVGIILFVGLILLLTSKMLEEDNEQSNAKLPTTNCTAKEIHR